ncbi:helix-turn-helix transcriptional regulator [bacterium]|nr:helix-turn-helix transcriptional regulator [bacterium]
MKYQELLAKNIKELRLRNNLTQEVFAEKIGLTTNGVSNIERNRYQPTAETIDKICKAFKISPAELLLMPDNSNNEIIENIVTLLSTCSTKKLKKILEMIQLMIKN